MNHPPVAERILTASTSLFLLVAPFTASAGWRAATLIVALSALVYLALTRRLAVPAPAAARLAARAGRLVRARRRLARVEC